MHIKLCYIKFVLVIKKPLKMKKAEMIKKVEESMGTLFTKDDVIFIINQLDDSTSKINFGELIGRLEAIVDDADDSDIEVVKHRCEFSISNGNEIEIDEVSLDTEDFKSSINHDIRQLIESVQEGEACQLEEAEAKVEAEVEAEAEQTAE